MAEGLRNCPLQASTLALSTRVWVLLVCATTQFLCRSAPRYACGGGALVCLLPGVCLLGKPTPVRAVVYHRLLLDGATEFDARRRMGAVFFNDSL